MASLADLIACVFAAGKQVDDIRTKSDALRVLGFVDAERCTHKEMLQKVLEEHMAYSDIAGMTIRELTSEVWRFAELAETKERIEEIAKDIAKKTRLENLDKAKKNKDAAVADAAVADAAVADAAVADAAVADAAVAAPVELEDVPRSPPSEASRQAVSMPFADLIAGVIAAGKTVDDIRTKADALRVLGFVDDEHHTHKEMLQLLLQEHMSNSDIAGMTIRELTGELWRFAELVETKERIVEIANGLAKGTKLQNLDRARRARSPSPN